MERPEADQLEFCGGTQELNLRFVSANLWGTLV
jgi:hypothetical protein